jgi:hypothetical protein
MGRGAWEEDADALDRERKVEDDLGADPDLGHGLTVG